MCRLVGWVAREPMTLRQLLGDVAVERLLHLSTVHCDGWGIAWHAADGLRVQRSAAQASTDPDFLEVADTVAASAAVLHLRLGTAGFGHGLADTHPFRDGGWALAHNGAVAPSTRVSELLPHSSPAPSAPVPQGSTDSERWFIALRAEYKRAPDDDPVRRVAAATSQVLARAAAAGLTCHSWNSLLLGPDALYVINDHDVAWLPRDRPVWPELPARATVSWPPYFDLRLREKDGARAVVSSGVVDDTDGWTLLANRCVVRLGFGDEPEQQADISSVGEGKR